MSNPTEGAGTSVHNSEVEALDPYKGWMVRSNLTRIAAGEASLESTVATLRANGYHRVADTIDTIGT